MHRLTSTRLVRRILLTKTSADKSMKRCHYPSKTFTAIELIQLKLQAFFGGRSIWRSRLECHEARVFEIFAASVQKKSWRTHGPMVRSNFGRQRSFGRKQSRKAEILQQGTISEDTRCHGKKQSRRAYGPTAESNLEPGQIFDSIHRLKELTPIPAPQRNFFLQFGKFVFFCNMYPSTRPTPNLPFTVLNIHP